MAIDYLRLSLTDRCDLNCIYCNPIEKARFLPREELLTHEETARAAAAFVRAGIKKIRLTGGEPLLKKDVVLLARMIKAIPGLRELALTTNGVHLAEMAADLRGAGVDCVNVSVDSLKRETFKKITGSDSFEKVWSGIQASLRAGFSQVKLNVVLMRGVNDGEIADFARLSVESPVTVRFIELFSANEHSAGLAGGLLPTAEVKDRIEAVYGPLAPAEPAEGGGPARGYRARDAKGGLGFISGSSGYFCGSCNRVRMDCSGNVYPCLFAPPTHNLRGPLRSGAADADLARHIKETFLLKSRYKKDPSSPHRVEMSSIGG